MKRIIGTAALFALVAAAAFTTVASAQCVTGTGTNILLKWDANGFAYETAPASGPLGPLANPVGFLSAPGNNLVLLASPSLLCGPLAAISLTDPGFEVVLWETGLTSGGTVVTPFGASGQKFTTVYTNGQFSVVQKPGVVVRGYTTGTVPPPAVAFGQYSAPGLLLIGGTIPDFTVVVTKSSFGNINGSFVGHYVIKGGSLAGAFCNGVQVVANMDGLWDVGSAPPGYEAHPNGKLDAPDCTTPVTPSTWGKIKAMYR